MKKYYEEPEFKVIVTTTQDVIATSGEELDGAPSGYEAGGLTL